VALIQLCFDTVPILIDPLRITDTQPLVDLLCDSAITKCWHSGSEDLEVFQYWLGLVPVPLFDTQKASAMLGYGYGLSYRALVAALCGVELEKEQTQSDWLARPLSDAQIAYAAADVTHLRVIADTLWSQAKTLGRLDWVLEESRGDLPVAKSPLARFKSAFTLNARSLAALTALADWREARAMGENTPRTWVLGDKSMMAIAQTLPQSLEALRRIEGMNGGILRKRSRDILACIADVCGLSAADLPAKQPPPASQTHKALIRDLEAVVKTRAEALEMSPEIVFSKRECGELIDALRFDKPWPAHWQGWRKDFILGSLVPLITGAQGAG
jgi:ribonuclease D